MPTPLRIAAQVTVDAEPEPVWRAAAVWPRRCVVIHTGRVIGGTGIFEVSPASTGSRSHWAEDVQLPLPPPLGRIAGWVAAPVAAWGLRSSLNRFARLFPRT